MPTPNSIWADTPMGYAYFAGIGISFVLLIGALTCTTYYRRGKLTAAGSGEGSAAKGEVTAGSSSTSRPAASVGLYDSIGSQADEKVEPFTMDSYEWHYDSALSAYRARHRKGPDDITDEDDERTWESSALYISCFVNWLISHDFIEPYDEESQRLQDSVRRREDTPYAYLNLMLDGKLYCSGIRWCTALSTYTTIPSTSLPFKTASKGKVSFIRPCSPGGNVTRCTPISSVTAVRFSRSAS